MKIGELVDLVVGIDIEVIDRRAHRKEREHFGKVFPAFERKVLVQLDNPEHAILGELVMGPDPYSDEISVFIEQPDTPYRLARPIFAALEEGS